MGAFRSRLRSFRYAFAGIHFALKQPNFRIHVTAFVAVVVAAWLLHLSPGEVVALIVVSLAVVTIELINTTIEIVVDMVTPDFHPLAKVAKDLSAAAVLVVALAALVVGLYVFIPHLIHAMGR